jgi:hypothetical protein
MVDLVRLERAVSPTIDFPAMRSDVKDALSSLADPERQRTVWGTYDKSSGHFEDLTLNLNILYDCHVLPDPQEAVGAAIFESELAAFELLRDAIVPLIASLGNAQDVDYIEDPRWPGVVEAAQFVLRQMEGQ